MANPVKQFLASVFTVAVMAGLGGGLMAMLDSPDTEQRNYPSLSKQDARKAYNDSVAAFSVIGAGVALASIRCRP